MLVDNLTACLLIRPIPKFYHPPDVLERCRFYGRQAAKEWYHAELEWYTPDPVEYLNVINELDIEESVRNDWNAYLNTNEGEDSMKKDPRFIAYINGWNGFRATHPM